MDREEDMKDLFKDILDVQDVEGVIFFSLDGKLVFSEFISILPEKIEHIDWRSFFHTLDTIREVELVFENSRFYVRRTGSGYILVVMGKTALIEMVRLNCNVLLPAFEATTKKPKGLGRIFKKT